MSKITSDSEGLQKLTDWKDVVNSDHHQAIDEGLTYEYINSLSDIDRQDLLDQITEAMNVCTVPAIDDLQNKLSVVLSTESKREQWQRNHSVILREIHNSFLESNRMPTKTEIACITGLSRQTVHSHLSDLPDNCFYREEIDQYKALVPKVLMQLYKHSLAGDTSSAKLFLEMVGERKGGHHQTNYIQINNLVLTEDRLKKLSSDQISQIEGWINSIE